MRWTVICKYFTTDLLARSESQRQFQEQHHCIASVRNIIQSYPEPHHSVPRILRSTVIDHAPRPLSVVGLRRKRCPVTLTQTVWVQFLPAPTHETCLCCSAKSGLMKLACRHQGQDNTGKSYHWEFGIIFLNLATFKHRDSEYFLTLLISFVVVFNITICHERAATVNTILLQT